MSLAPPPAHPGPTVAPSPSWDSAATIPSLFSAAASRSHRALAPSESGVHLGADAAATVGNVYYALYDFCNRDPEFAFVVAPLAPPQLMQRAAAAAAAAVMAPAPAVAAAIAKARARACDSSASAGAGESAGDSDIAPAVRRPCLASAYGPSLPSDASESIAGTLTTPSVAVAASVIVDHAILPTSTTTTTPTASAAPSAAAPGATALSAARREPLTSIAQLSFPLASLFLPGGAGTWTSRVVGAVSEALVKPLCTQIKLCVRSGRANATRASHGDISDSTGDCDNDCESESDSETAAAAAALAADVVATIAADSATETQRLCGDSSVDGDDGEPRDQQLGQEHYARESLVSDSLLEQIGFASHLGLAAVLIPSPYAHTHTHTGTRTRAQQSADADGKATATAPAPASVNVSAECNLAPLARTLAAALATAKTTSILVEMPFAPPPAPRSTTESGAPGLSTPLDPWRVWATLATACQDDPRLCVALTLGRHDVCHCAGDDASNSDSGSGRAKAKEASQNGECACGGLTLRQWRDVVRPRFTLSGAAVSGPHEHSDRGQSDRAQSGREQLSPHAPAHYHSSDDTGVSKASRFDVLPIDKRCPQPQPPLFIPPTLASSTTNKSSTHSHVRVQCAAGVDCDGVGCGNFAHGHPYALRPNFRLARWRGSPVRAVIVPLSLFVPTPVAAFGNADSGSGSSSGSGSGGGGGGSRVGVAVSGRNPRSSAYDYYSDDNTADGGESKGVLTLCLSREHEAVLHTLWEMGIMTIIRDDLSQPKNKSSSSKSESMSWRGVRALMDAAHTYIATLFANRYGKPN